MKIKIHIRGANPLKKIFSKSGGVDRCSTPPSKIQGGLRPPQPPPCLAPLRNFAVAGKHDAVLEVIDGQAIL